MSLASCPLPTATLIQAYSVRQFKMSTSPPADIIQDRSDALEERYTAPRSEKHTFPSIELFSRGTLGSCCLTRRWTYTYSTLPGTDKSTTIPSCGCNCAGHSSKNTGPKASFTCHLRTSDTVNPNDPPPLVHTQRK